MMEDLDISKAGLSAHITALLMPGVSEQQRAVRDTRQRVWLRPTPPAVDRTRGPNGRFQHTGYATAM
jgi:hypothetical protein